MASREIVGLGSVWESDPGDDDVCGVFRWKLEVKQIGQRLFMYLFRYSGDNGSWYDGWYDLTSSIKMSSQDWPCDDAGEVMGQRVLIACVTTAKGKNSGFTVSGSASGSGLPGSPASGTGLSVSYTPGYSGQKLEWTTELEICPGAEGCPDVKVLDIRASVSDSEYFWGDEVTQPRSGESGSVRRHMPMVGIGACDAELELHRERRLPIDAIPVESAHTARG